MNEAVPHRDGCLSLLAWFLFLVLFSPLARPMGVKRSTGSCDLPGSFRCLMWPAGAPLQAGTVRLTRVPYNCIHFHTRGAKLTRRPDQYGVVADSEVIPLLLLLF